MTPSPFSVRTTPRFERLARALRKWRLSFGRFRLRYDIYDNEVILQYCGLRREDTSR